MSSVPIIGPIQPSDVILLTAYIPNQELYVLNSYNGPSGISLLFDSNVGLQVAQTGSMPQTVPTFQLSGVSNAIHFFINNLGFDTDLAFDANNQAYIPIPSISNPLIPRQDNYRSWGDPVLMLSGVQYNLSNVGTTGGSSGIFNYGTIDNGVANILGTTTNVVPLPISYFFNCPHGGQNTTPEGSICAAYCANNPTNLCCVPGTNCGGASGSFCLTTAPTGFTIINDCEDNNYKYSYCTINETCGQNNCKGPCPQGQGGCQYVQTNPNFICSSQPIPPPNHPVEPFYKQPWFIATIVIVGIVFILTIALVLYFGFRKKK